MTCLQGGKFSFRAARALLDLDRVWDESPEMQEPGMLQTVCLVTAASCVSRSALGASMFPLGCLSMQGSR